MNQFTLDYYFFPECPYCHRVERVINQLNIKVNYFDINNNSDALKKLLNDTGKKTVPCLYINGKPMHESADIIIWLKENFKE
jgi:glutaredoxin